MKNILHFLIYTNSNNNIFLDLFIMALTNAIKWAKIYSKFIK